MTYSKIHQLFSKYLKQPNALTNPEKYLGPKWRNVLNFWIYLDTLSDPEKDEIAERYDALDFNVQCSAIDFAIDAAGEVVGYEFRSAAWCAAWNVTGLRVFRDATVELIGSHKILEQDKILTFLPICVKP